MKYAKTFLILTLVLNGLFLNPAFSDVPTSNLDLVTQRYLEAIQVKAEYGAKLESLKDEIFWLRAQNIALFFVVSYMAVNK